ncbi:uncharacterized protein LOC132187956 [Corylus avellana]|uniref:uncharacterized protein LOC132187956 n=1 Tax=Corylus avellana TaxID=13451 RepID=UPI00286AD823|nr:uncharacterized protein LOC132187956 [Corylus avellana]
MEMSGCLHDWTVLTQALLERFGPLGYDDPMEALSKLKQTTSVDDYKEKYEALSNRVRGIDDQNRLSCFLGGLKNEIRLPVRMFKPQSLLAAYGLAKVQEEHVLNGRRFKTYSGSGGNFSSLGMPRGEGFNSHNLTLGTPKAIVSIQKISQAQMEDRRKKGLCYNCDAKWQYGHKCQNPKLFLLEGLDELEVSPNLELEKEDLMEVSYAEENPEISLHAITGSQHPKTMRLVGWIGNLKIMILVDSGSTHNFVDSSVCKKVRMSICSEQRIKVKVANGEEVLSEGKCTNLKIQLKEFSFLAEAFVIMLAGCDMVLGIQCVEDTETVLKGSELEGLLAEVSDIFAEPKGLPPHRSQDHAIVLKLEAKPVCVRPYRKADGSWRMCMDYRALNNETIKDKFPIPVIDELLDELHGSRVYSKLDLRSGYHQIRVKKEDIHKTAFRTHEGHYEFLVMPFGLTNAPSTFQSLMNDIFRPYLRKFILVFFDDILVYSPNLILHLQHLQVTLEILRSHQLLAKRSKCRFGCSEVDYLGHLISAEGVRADSKKLSAMAEWSKPKSLKALRGFLGFTGYYRKFVKGYGSIAAPLTDLLKKNDWQWNEMAEKAFEDLKKSCEGTEWEHGTYKIFCGSRGTVLQEEGLCHRGLEESGFAFYSCKSPGRLTKYSHFIPLKHPYTAEKLALIFMSQIFKLHGMPQSIISNRDSTFTSRFWTEVFKLEGVFLAFSTAYHPQSDGQSEAVNKYVENYLRCMVCDRLKEWVTWLDLAEYCYNTSFHHSTRVTPFEALYGYLPPRLLTYMPGTTKIAAVEDQLQTRDHLLQLLKENIQRSQDRMKRYADLKRTERSFQEGDWVYLRLQPYRQLSLKLKLGRSIIPISHLPPVDAQGIIKPEPEEILNRRSRKIHNRAVVELLVRWQGQLPE